MKYSELNRLIKQQQDNITFISDVISGYSYNYNYLLAEVIPRYVWNGLPATIDSNILEKMLMTCGSIIPVEKNNEIYIQATMLYGVGVYVEEPPYNVYANPILGSGNFEVDWKNEPCVLYDNSARFNKNSIIERTAMKLARTESAIDIILTNNNGTEILLAKNNNISESIKKIFEERKKGNLYVPVNDDIIDVIAESVKIIENSKNPNIPDVNQLLILYNNQLRQFYRDFGILITKDKSQAVLSDETENDSIYTNNILNDSLDMRKKWCEEMNKKYDLNISVEISKYLINTPQQEEENQQEEEKQQEEEPQQEDEPQQEEE